MSESLSFVQFKLHTLGIYIYNYLDFGIQLFLGKERKVNFSLNYIFYFIFSDLFIMISLSDAIRLESNNPAVNTFKPWWEVAVDYTFNVFLLVVLFALAGVTLSGTPGLVCLPSDNNLTSFNYATNLYVNAKCTTHVDGHILIIFPYVIFAQWLLLFVLHLSWFNLPALKAFLSSSFDTFKVLKEVDEMRPRTRRVPGKRAVVSEEEQSSNTAEDSMSEDDDNPSSETGRNVRLVYLVDSLQYLLQFKYNLVNVYAAKSLTTCALTIIITASIVTWLVTFKWRTAFSCDLRDIIPPPYDLSTCSFAAAPYVYSMMILNVVFAVFLCIFNFCALAWLVKFKLSFNRYMTRWKGKHPLKDKPGFYDYFFCVKLLKSNTSEGGVVFKTMELAFKAFGDKTPEEMEVASEFALAVPAMPSYCKDWFISTEILLELGMEHKRSADNHDELWVALANSLEQDAPVLSGKQVVKAVSRIREKVLEELLKRQLLFKDLINKDDHCPIFEEYLEDIKKEEPRKNGIIGDHYVFMAYAIVYCVNVVVLRAQKSSMLYEPEHPEENQSIRYITFVEPYYYYASSVKPNTTTEQKDAVLKFLTDQGFQTSLLKKGSDLWESKGYEEYKRTLEDILPQELLYKSETVSEIVSKSDLEKKEGLRQRFGRRNVVSGRIETFSLMDV